jgi:16S rRNA processing protein RimM
VRLATVARAHGLRGQIVVHIDATMKDIVVPGLAVRLEKSSESQLDTRVTGVRASGPHLVLTLDALDDRTAAEAWASAGILVTRDRLPAVDEDQYFDFELLDAEVVDTEGAALGRVREIVPTGANDVLVACGPLGEVLIPVTRRAVVEVNRAAHRIVVDARALVYQDERGRS